MFRKSRYENWMFTVEIGTKEQLQGSENPERFS